MLSALTLLVAAAAAAAPTVAPVFACDDAPDLAVLWERAADELRAGGWTIVETPDALRSPRYLCGDGHRAARDAIARGRQSFMALDIASARRSFGEATALLMGARSFVGARELYIDATMYLAWIAAESSEPKRSSEHIEDALRVSPELALDGQRFPPAILDAVARAGSVRRAERRALTIVAEPPNAQIFVDGAACGQGRCVLDVLPGAHLVEAQAVGYRSALDKILLERAAAPWSHRLQLVEDTRSRLIGAVERGDASVVAALARPFDVGRLLVLLPERAGTRVLGSVVGTEPPSLAPPLPLDGSQPGIAATQLAWALGAPPAGVEQSSPARINWVWPAIGIGAAALLTGVVLWALPEAEVHVRP